MSESAPSSPAIAGTVLAGEPAVDLVFVTPGGSRLTRLAVVDTGFDGTLTLPPLLFAKLAGTPTLTRRITVADGRAVQCDAAVVRVEWCGTLRKVLAVRLGRGAVIGMALLAGHRLTIDAADGGAVTITPLSQSNPDVSP